MTRHLVLAALAASALAIGMLGRAAAQAAQDIAGTIVGTWEWVAVENTTSDGTLTHPFGPKPGGYLTFDRSGRFFWLITRPGRPKFASGRRDQGSADENKATVQGSLAYAGTYAVDRGDLIMKIDASTYPNEEGAEQKRAFTLNGDELSWRNPTVSTGASGVARLRRLK
jgi:hypothetical protein